MAENNVEGMLEILQRVIRGVFFEKVTINFGLNEIMCLLGGNLGTLPIHAPFLSFYI